MKAISICPGNFVHIEHICMDDSQGRIGRSRARNIAVRTACDRGMDWLFFIDADDLMAPNAFEIASLLSGQYDAIWGKICSFDHATNQIDERPGQLGETTHLYDIVFNDPYLTLQMGHFVKSEIAATSTFDEAMDTGEDFDYYLRIWKQYRCIRLDAPLFINRRGFHSGGPRSADGADWREAVHGVIDRFCDQDKPVTSFIKYDSEIRFQIRNPFDIIQRQLIMGDFFEIDELEFIRSMITTNACILEVGANIGNHIVYYSRFTSCDRIIAIEPNPEAIAILNNNLQLNGIKNVDTSRLGVGVGDRNARYRLETRENNLGATQLVEDTSGEIRAVRIDDIIDEDIDFIKIDVENMELEVLDGARELIRASKPQILIEVMNGNLEKFQDMIAEIGYRITTTFRNVNAANFFIEPIDAGGNR
jgi:FkbM family methyltransferase